MSQTTTRPGIRWPGIIWGALFALAAGVGILVLAVPDPQAVVGWIRPLLYAMRPEWFSAIVPLSIGLLVIALGVVWALQRRRFADAAEPAAEARAEAVAGTSHDG